MSAYVVVEIDVHDPERYETYKQLAPSSIAAHGGRVETLEGTWLPKRLVILEFPSLAQASAWWSSTEYAEAKALRQAVTRTQMIVVEGI